MALDVDLADRLAERAVDHVDAALPAIALVGNVAQRFRIEIEPRLVEILGQIGRMAADEMDGHIVLPRRERHAVDQLADFLHRGGFGDDDGLDVAEPGLGQRPVPMELRSEGS